MKRLFLFGVLLTSVLVLLYGCSVKENRADCPGYLYVNIPEDERMFGEVGMIGWNGTEVFRHYHSVEADGRTWHKSLRKGAYEFLSFFGVDEANDDGHTLIMPVGHQCDSLYAFHCKVELEERAFVDIEMKKQFATVHVDLDQTAPGMAYLRFVAEADYNGFDLRDFSPVKGEFSYPFEVGDNSRIATFRVPRQGDDKLRLQIYTPEGIFLKEIVLGEYIRDLGYSWKSDELQDIFLFLDFQYGIMSIRVADWDEEIVISFIEN